MSLDPKRTHSLEQFEAFLTDIARHIAAFYRELIDGGVPEAEARALTMEVGRMWFKDPEPMLREYIGGGQ